MSNSLKTKFNSFLASFYSRLILAKGRRDQRMLEKQFWLRLKINISFFGVPAK